MPNSLKLHFLICKVGIITDSLHLPYKFVRMRDNYCRNDQNTFYVSGAYSPHIYQIQFQRNEVSVSLPHFLVFFFNKCPQKMSYLLIHLIIHCLPLLECKILWVVTMSFHHYIPSTQISTWHIKDTSVLVFDLII